MKVRRVWAAGVIIAGLCVVSRMEVSAEDSSLSEKQETEAEEQKVLEPKVESVTQKETSEQEAAKQPEVDLGEKEKPKEAEAVSELVAEKSPEEPKVAAEEAKAPEVKPESSEPKVADSEPKAVEAEPKQEETPKEDAPVADRTVEESLVLARAEADFFLQKLIDLVRRNEALGIAALTDDQQEMNEKFVKLMGELSRSEKKKSALEDAIKRMIDTQTALEKASDDAEKQSAREKYQIALREASEILKGQIVCPVKTAEGLSDSEVLDVDGSGKIVVVNAGKFQGMKIGMTFHLVRGDEVIGECRVMEVREYLSAALCESGEKEKSVQLGDRLLPAVTSK